MSVLRSINASEITDEMLSLRKKNEKFIIHAATLLKHSSGDIAFCKSYIVIGEEPMKIVQTCSNDGFDVSMREWEKEADPFEVIKEYLGDKTLVEEHKDKLELSWRKLKATKKGLPEYALGITVFGDG